MGPPIAFGGLEPFELPRGLSASPSRPPAPGHLTATSSTAGADRVKGRPNKTSIAQPARGMLARFPRWAGGVRSRHPPSCRVRSTRGPALASPHLCAGGNESSLGRCRDHDSASADPGTPGPRHRGRQRGRIAAGLFGHLAKTRDVVERIAVTCAPGRAGSSPRHSGSPAARPCKRADDDDRWVRFRTASTCSPIFLNRIGYAVP